MNVGVLASGTGTNLQALIDRVHGRGGITIVAVGSDRADAQALARARAVDIPQRAFALSDFSDRRKRDLAMADWLQSLGVELVVAAGYMRLLDPAFLDAFPQRVINVHPALLPAFPGLHVVQQALDYGVKVFGVTVHFLDSGVDTGPIILQRALHLPDADNVDQVLAELHPVEHELLAEAVILISRGAVGFDPANPRRVVITPTPPSTSGR
jgi:phosphoribosylglycinamide formyltransferase-1